MAFENFSGYIAVDEVYDGPFCILSLVDNRTFKRLLYRFLPHDSKHGDIRELFRSFRDILKQRETDRGNLSRRAASNLRISRQKRNQQAGTQGGGSSAS